MSNHDPDLESQPSNISQQASSSHTVDRAPNDQRSLNNHDSRGLCSLFRLRKLVKPDDKGKRQSTTDTQAPTEQDPSPNKHLAKVETLLQGKFKLRRTKLQPKDGYTTHSFNNLSRPLPVEDLFFCPRLLIAIRLIFQGSIFCWAVYCWFTALSSLVGGSWWLLVFIMLLAFQWKSIHGIGSINIPTLRQFFSFHRYPQRFWVCRPKLLLPGHS
jgi:hypothetical protein